MADETHAYETAIEWTEGVHGTAHADGRAAIHVGAPPEFGGDTQGWSPEQLCVASVNACLMLTFLTVAQRSKVPFLSYAARATGILEKVEGKGPVITRVIVRPRVDVPAGVTVERVAQLLQIAKRHCFISNSLAGEVVIEPEIAVRQ